MAKVLTDLGVKNAKPKHHQGKAVITEISDGGCRGLRLVLHPTGHRSWIVRYRRPDGRTAKLTLGPAIIVRKGDPVPEHALTLALARKHATDALHQLALGIDPGIEKAASKQPTTHTTFERVATDCFTREANRGLRSAQRQLHDLERLVFPVFGRRPMAAVRRGDVVRLLDSIEDEHGAVMADAVLAGVRKVMNWWSIRDENYAVPLVRGMRRSNPKERARSRILDDDELRAVWKAASEMEAPYGPFIQFLLLVGSRRREAAGMRRDEVRNGIWILPTSRSKTKQEVVRPLSRAAQEVLERMPKIAGSAFVFTLGGGVPINSFHLLKEIIDERSGVSGWRLHDCRRTVRTLLSRANVSADIAGRCLGHALPSIRGVYDQHDYVPQMKVAFEALAALIETIVAPNPNVLPVRGQCAMPRPKPKKIGLPTREQRGSYDTGNYFPEDFARKLVRQHPDENLPFVLPFCGPRVVAEELIRRYRLKCRQEHIKYDRHEREHAIAQAARMVSEVRGRHLNPETLRNWLNRSKRARTPKRLFKS